jgi:hypothetical protein
MLIASLIRWSISMASDYLSDGMLIASLIRCLKSVDLEVL